jgi:choline dehydrogenase-like flavoprotein
VAIPNSTRHDRRGLIGRGTVRFGVDPNTSVLDRDCKAHDLDNLYVVDTSCFPSASACKPVLTIVANSLRVADRLKARL